MRAPFDGIVSDRKVSAGDTAQIGKELLKVIDPASLRFEGFVSADNIGEVKTGQHVWFRVHGYDEQEFTGKVTRVNPAANSTTRQVEVLVGFDDAKQQPNVAGLYAEGRVETRSTASARLPGRIGGARRRQGLRLARERRQVAEGGADAGRTRRAQRRLRRCSRVSPKATRCCAIRTPRSRTASR